MLVEDMSRNKCFFQVRISHVLCFISICELFTDSPSNIFIGWCLINHRDSIIFVFYKKNSFFSTKLDKQSGYNGIFYVINQKDGSPWKAMEKMEYARSEQA
jgi:hypothetical protein